MRGSIKEREREGKRKIMGVRESNQEEREETKREEGRGKNT